MTIGIIVAMDKEMASLRTLLCNTQEETFGQFTYITGMLNDKRIVLHKCGLGKVNAAVGAVEFIDHYKPDYLISSGVAGGIDTDVKIMDVVVANELVYHDAYVGEEGEGMDIVSPYPVSSHLLQRAQAMNLPQVKFGTICTGDQFITDRAKLEDIKSRYPNGLAVDMESCAIAHACKIMNTPFISMRIISDTVGSTEHVEEYMNFWATLADNSFNTLHTFLNSL